MDKPKAFSMTDVCGLSGATPSQIENWCRSGIIVPLQDSPGRGSPRLFSLQNGIEAAMARELQQAKLSPVQLKTVFAQHRETVSKVPPELRASATFVRYTQVVKGIVAITGRPGPNYAKWKEGVTAILRSWQRKQTPLDDRILQILAGQRAAERDAAGDARG